jgi:hypothetical protein
MLNGLYNFVLVLPCFDVILLEILPVLFFNLLKNKRQRLPTCIKIVHLHTF